MSQPASASGADFESADVVPQAFASAVARKRSLAAPGKPSRLVPLFEFTDPKTSRKYLYDPISGDTK